MRRIEISCIKKFNHKDIHHSIEYIGGVHNGTKWKTPEWDAIDKIEKGFFSYYVSVDGREVDVVIATREGKKYLKTENDGVHSNNLLELNECTRDHY